MGDRYRVQYSTVCRYVVLWRQRCGARYRSTVLRGEEIRVAFALTLECPGRRAIDSNAVQVGMKDAEPGLVLLLVACNKLGKLLEKLPARCDAGRSWVGDRLRPKDQKDWTAESTSDKAQRGEKYEVDVFRDRVNVDVTLLLGKLRCSKIGEAQSGEGWVDAER